MKKMKDYVKNYLKEVNENGFSLLELVVAVGVLLVLTVGGLLAYNGITQNARVAAVQSAADEVYTGAVAYDSNGQNYKDAVDEWNGSSKKDKDNKASIVVSVDEDKYIASGEICITAFMEEYDISVNRGAGCVSEGVVPPVNPGDGSGNPGDDISFNNLYEINGTEITEIEGSNSIVFDDVIGSVGSTSFNRDGMIVNNGGKLMSVGSDGAAVGSGELIEKVSSSYSPIFKKTGLWWETNSWDDYALYDLNNDHMLAEDGYYIYKWNEGIIEKLPDTVEQYGEEIPVEEAYDDEYYEYEYEVVSYSYGGNVELKPIAGLENVNVVKYDMWEVQYGLQYTGWALSSDGKLYGWGHNDQGSSNPLSGFSEEGLNAYKAVEIKVGDESSTVINYALTHIGVYVETSDGKMWKSNKSGIFDEIPSMENIGIKDSFQATSRKGYIVGNNNVLYYVSGKEVYATNITNMDKVISVSTNTMGSNSYLLYEDGTVYADGSHEHGKRGDGFTGWDHYNDAGVVYSDFTKVKGLDGEKAVKVIGDRDGAYVITESGKLFTFGRNSTAHRNLSGSTNGDTGVGIPMDISSHFDGNIIDIVVPNGDSNRGRVVLTDSGNVYQWGGYYSSDKSEVKLIAENISEISKQGDSVFLADKNMKVFYEALKDETVKEINLPEGMVGKLITGQYIEVYKID